MDSQGHTESGKSSTQQNIGFSASTWVSFPHMVNCHSLYPTPCHLSPWLELLSLNSVPQTFCALSLIMLGQAVLGRQPTRYPVNSSFHSYTQAVLCTKTLFPFSRRKLLIIDTHGLCVPKRPRTCLCVWPSPAEKGKLCSKALKGGTLIEASKRVSLIFLGPAFSHSLSPAPDDTGPAVRLVPKAPSGMA